MDFYQLIQEYPITIPLIQRDYVQGHNEKVIKEFLQSIKERNHLFIDLIFGYQENGEFIPIDGQQRLTTLYLLYLDPKARKVLNYSFRPEVEEFLDELHKANSSFPRRDFVKAIKESPWFSFLWERNITISSMLKTLEIIEDLFQGENPQVLEKVQFRLPDMEEYSLGEKSYIAMNARGKLLDQFENLKAEFFKANPDIDPEKAANFDNDYLDFFWKRFHDIDKSNRAFYNLLQFLAEMFHYKMGERTPFSFRLEDIVRQLTKNREGLFFVLDHLDTLERESSRIDTLLNAISNQSDTTFDDLLDGKLSITQKILLFQLIDSLRKRETDYDSLDDYFRIMRNILFDHKTLKTHQLRWERTIGSDDIPSYLDHFGRLLDGVKKHGEAYEALLKLEATFQKRSFEKEQRKATYILAHPTIKETIFQLEDTPLTQGDIDNFLPSHDIVVSENDLKKLRRNRELFFQIFHPNTEDPKRIGAMLTVFDEEGIGHDLWVGNSVIEGKWCDKWYFGREGYWDILVQNGEKRQFWQKFLEKLANHGGDLEKMRASFLSSYQGRDWRYYFIKYPELFEQYFPKDRNIITFHCTEEKCSLFLLEKLTNRSLLGFHLNPLYFLIAQRLKEKIEVVPQNGGHQRSYLQDRRGCRYRLNEEDRWEEKCADGEWQVIEEIDGDGDLVEGFVEFFRRKTTP
ncbi:MAG: hypothetical protein C6I05_05930 [Epsilonproteobacteria bacterium]|nr:hypothetical protein [Campylobacterota bacterium]NPA83436.1 DUF262 domain-containing protein [Campylobacterota bacterium]